MDDTSLLALGVGAGVVGTLLIEWLHMSLMAWWDRRQAQDAK